MYSLMKKTKGINKYLVVILSAQVLLLMFLTWKFGIQRLDGDDSAEMILANLLAREGGILSRNWFYSTEIRVLNNQIVMSLLFRVFKNWLVVRTLGTGILVSLLALSYLFMCSRIPEGEQLKKWAPVVLLPFSYVYYDIILYGLYYIPHISIIFLSLGLLLSQKKRRVPIEPILLLLLAFTAGLGGIRLPAVGYAPIFLAALIMFWRSREKRTLIWSFAACAATGIGYLINSLVLYKLYSCMSHDVALTGLNLGRAKNVLINTLQVCGAGRPSLSVRGIGGAAGVLLVISIGCMLVLLIKNRKQISAPLRIIILTFVFSWLITAFSGVFTTAGWSNRYAMIPCMGFIPILAAGTSLRETANKKYLKGAIMGLLLICSASQVYRFVTEDKLSEVRPAYDYIMNAEFTFGYSTWEVGDVLTEVTDGRIHVCKVQNYENLWRWNWLMEKDYMKYSRLGRVFLLLDKERLTYTDGHTAHLFGSWTEKDLTWMRSAEVGFEDDHFIVWVFPSEDEFETITGSYPHD